LHNYKKKIRINKKIARKVIGTETNAV